MRADNRPQAFGVFKPVDHVVVSFKSADDLDQAADELADAGFAGDDCVRYSPQEMVRQADRDIAQASGLASVGQELNLVKAHRELAAQGHSFLVVKAPSKDDTERVAEVVNRHHATRAQKYGRFMIEELTEVGSQQAQVAESPDRGLDPQTRSGREGGPESGVH